MAAGLRLRAAIALLADVFNTPRGRVLVRSRGAMAVALAALLMVALPKQNHMAESPSASVLAPDYLSARDRELYQQAFDAERAGDIAASAGALERVDNKVLEGYVLAERYTRGHYQATAADLEAWLTRYADHPQASQLRGLAAARGVTNLGRFDIESAALKGDGFIDHIGRKSMPDIWYSGLSHFKAGNYAQAAAIFSNLGKDEKLSDWQRAASYYWAYRADKALGNRYTARTELKNASAFSTTFYGLLAMRERGREISLAAAAPHVPSHIRNDGHAVRARALAALGELSLAEAELRQLYADLGSAERAAVITLASEINLANLQVRLSHLKGLSDDEQVFAAYPMPAWLTSAQTIVDPALVLAIARQESVFREEVSSPAGAVGMMQMLPSTARMMMRGLKADGIELASIASDQLPMAEQLTNPQLNIRLGAEYVKHLTEQPYIGNNLVKILAGYNAGPGSVSAWQKTAAAKITDPLLYIESIPFAETRNYVMQVLAHYWVYQSLMGENSTTLTQLSQGEWPNVSL